MTIAERIAGLLGFPRISAFNASDESDRADAYAHKSDALEDRLSLLLELSRAVFDAHDEWEKERDGEIGDEEFIANEREARLKVASTEADLRAVTDALEGEHR